MKIQGNLLKMKSINEKPVQYYLHLGEKEILMNELIGSEISLHYLNQINCIKCGRKTNKSFAQGYCFPCFRSAPETEECVLRPELCQAHKGIARDIDFAKEHCLIDHFVYLAYTSGLKVGVTRNTQIPTRWIDQGAVAAIQIAKTPNRHLAGLIEVALKAHINDKTNWRAMLKGPELTVDLQEEKEKAIRLLPESLQEYTLQESEPYYLSYPVETVPEKIESITFDKIEQVTEILTGIRGQYLMFASGKVLNIRKHNGYLVELSF